MFPGLTQCPDLELALARLGFAFGEHISRLALLVLKAGILAQRFLQ